MENAKPSVFTKPPDGNTKGIDRVIKQQGMYAFFMEAAAIEYWVQRKCELTQLGGLLDSKGYGIALPPGSPYTKVISEGVVKLQEQGVIEELKTKWWTKMRGGGTCEVGQAKASARLTLQHLGGVFIVLL